MEKLNKVQAYASFLKNAEYSILKSGSTVSQHHAKALFEQAQKLTGDKKAYYGSFNNLYISSEESCRAYYLYGFSICKKLGVNIPNEKIVEFAEIYLQHKSKFRKAIETILKITPKAIFHRGGQLIDDNEQEIHRKELTNKFKDIDVLEFYNFKNLSLYVSIDLEKKKFTEPYHSVPDYAVKKITSVASQLIFILNHIEISGENKTTLELYYTDWIS